MSGKDLLRRFRKPIIYYLSIYRKIRLIHVTI